MPWRALAAPAWVLLTVFIAYASAGTWTLAGPRIWAPVHISWPDAAQNVLTYIPFGILGVQSLAHRQPSLLARVGAVAVLAILFSLTVETWQLYTEERTASVIDVLAALAGTVAGAWGARPFAQVVDWSTAWVRPSGVFDAEDRVVLVALTAALVVAAWWPLDPTLDVSTLAGRLRGIRQDPWQLDAVTVVGQALTFTWLGLAIAACARRLRRTHAVIAAATVATVVALVLDAGQLAMGSQPIGLAGLGAQVAGAMTGVALFALARGPK